MALIFLAPRHRVLHLPYRGRRPRVSTSNPFLLMLMLLPLASALSASGSMQGQAIIEEVMTTSTSDNRMWEADSDLPSDASLVSWQQSAFRSAENTTSSDAPDAAKAAERLSSASPSEPHAAHAAQEMNQRKPGHKLRLVGGAASAGLLLLLSAIGISLLFQRAAKTAGAPLLGEPPASGPVALEFAATAAAKKVQYLEKLAADAERLANLCKTEKIEQALEKITSSVHTATEQKRQIQLLLKRFEMQQKKQTQQQKQQTPRESDWMFRWLLLDHAFSAAVDATYILLKASVLPLSASAGIASERTSRLSIMKEKARSLVEEADSALDPSEASFLKAYLLPVQLNAEKAQSELRMLRASALKFESRLQQQAEASDPPLALVQEALAVSQQATERRLRVQSLLHAASRYLKDGELAVLALSQSAAVNLAVDVIDMRKQSELVRFMLQSVPVPEAHKPQAQKYMHEGSALDELTLQIQQLHQELQFTSDPTEALRNFQHLSYAYAKASEQMAEAPAIRIIPVEVGEQGLGQATLALSFDGEPSGDAVFYQEADEEKQNEETREMRTILVGAVASAMKEMSRGEGLSFDDDTQRQLTEENNKRFSEGLLPSRRLFRKWQSATNEMEEAEKAATQAAQRLADEEEKIVLLKTADEALRQARLVATAAALANHYWLRCSAWLKLENALSRALDNYGKAFLSVQQLEQQQRGKERDPQQQQQQQPPMLRDAASLQAEAESYLRNEDVEAVCRLMADVEELARQASFFFQQREAAQDRDNIRMVVPSQQ
ncbi:hypothetical protein Emag_003972 [Eimeria magna]